MDVCDQRLFLSGHLKWTCQYLFTHADHVSWYIWPRILYILGLIHPFLQRRFAAAHGFLDVKDSMEPRWRSLCRHRSRDLSAGFPSCRLYRPGIPRSSLPDTVAWLPFMGGIVSFPRNVNRVADDGISRVSHFYLPASTWPGKGSTLIKARRGKSPLASTILCTLFSLARVSCIL